jgi:hypothetical protein
VYNTGLVYGEFTWAFPGWGLTGEISNGVSGDYYFVKAGNMMLELGLLGC